MGDKNIIFLFPSMVFSGHEKMAIKILDKSPYRVSCILNDKLKNSFYSNNNYFSYCSFFSLIKILLNIRIHSRRVSIILVAGSPYGFLLEKILIKLLFFSLIDYVPVPELNIIQDRFYHKFMPFLNKILIDKRLLIDEWQKKYSSVRIISVIKNII